MLLEKRKVSKADIDKMMEFVVMLKEEDTYIAWCPILDESSEGDTPGYAKQGLRHAIKLRLQDKNMPVPKDVKIEGVTMMSVFITPAEIGAKHVKNTQTIGARSS